MENTLRDRSVARVAGSVKRPGSYKFTAANLSGSQLGPDMDPVLGIDHFWMRGAVFAPHPHAGFLPSPTCSKVFRPRVEDFPMRTFPPGIDAHTSPVASNVTESTLTTLIAAQRGQLPECVGGSCEQLAERYLVATTPHRPDDADALRALAAMEGNVVIKLVREPLGQVVTSPRSRTFG